MFDLIIVGAGPIGLACAIEAKKNNLNYLVLEKGTLTNSIYNYPLYMTFFSTSERLEIGGIPFNCISPKPGRHEALEYYRNVSNYFGLNVHTFEEVDSIQKEGNFIVGTNKSVYRTKNVIISTGFYDEPILMNIPGEELPKTLHYFKESHPFAFKKIVVVGANNSAVDAALESWRKGAEVTMAIRGSSFTDRLKYWVRPDIENRINEGSIKAYFNANLIEIKENSAVIESEEGLAEIENDFVLAMTGYKPNFAFLEKSGIEISKDENCLPNYNPETMETNVKGLYLAGVVCGGMQTHKWFIENSRVHAEMIINHIQKDVESD